jgi:molybdenum cofactor synthesis domain-containing protein
LREKGKSEMKVAILTVSDKGSRGDREDLSGAAIGEWVVRMRGEVAAHDVVPDNPREIMARLKEYCDNMAVDLVLTTGGTGFSPRDNTPEATAAVIEKLAPGVAEAIRFEGLKSTPLAMLSRALAGIRRKTLIINLPGSRRGVVESLVAVEPVIEHAIEILRGEAGECGAE